MAEQDFPKGIFAKMPHANAPDFVKAKISIKRIEAIDWINSQIGEYINLDLKVSKEGKMYLSIDTWKPTPNETQPPVESKPIEQLQNNSSNTGDDLPF